MRLVVSAAFWRIADGSTWPAFDCFFPPPVAPGRAVTPAPRARRSVRRVGRWALDVYTALHCAGAPCRDCGGVSVSGPAHRSRATGGAMGGSLAARCDGSGACRVLTVLLHGRAAAVHTDTALPARIRLHCQRSPSGWTRLRGCDCGCSASVCGPLRFLPWHQRRMQSHGRMAHRQPRKQTPTPLPQRRHRRDRSARGRVPFSSRPLPSPGCCCSCCCCPSLCSHSRPPPTRR